MPASPRLISCPPPTRQITTAQSLWRSRYDSRNSGSDCVKPGPTLLAAHEVGSHLAIPCALGLVKNHDAIARGPVLVQSCISEVVHVLNERFDLLLHDPFAGSVLLGAQTCHLIAGQRLAQHLHQRAIARQEHRVGRRVAALFRGHVEADQRLARTGHTSDEDDRFPAGVTGEVDDLFHTRGM